MLHFNHVSSMIPIGPALRLLALFVTLHSGVAYAKDGFSIRPWPLSQKLSQETILSIVHASDGRLWIATLSGIDSFDGNRFTKYRPHKTDGRHIASSSIVHILESSAGEIFVATKDAGLLKFDEIENKFSSVEVLDNFQAKGGRISSAFSDRSGVFWIGYESGKVLRYAPDSKTTVELNTQSDERIVDFTQDPAGNVYIASVSGQILISSAESGFLERLNLEPACAEKISFLEEIAANSNEHLWLGTSGAGLLMLDIISGDCSTPNYIANDNLKIEIAHIHDIYFDFASGSTWVGGDQGLYRIDKALNITILASESLNLTDNEVASIESNGNGALWIGTYKGLNYLVPSAFESYDQNNSRDLHSVVAIDSSDWIGKIIATYNGLFLFDSETKSHRNIEDSWPEWNLQNNQVMSLNLTTEGMWVGYRSAGLEFLSLEKDRAVISWREGASNALSADAVSSVLSTQDGKILVGTYGGGLNIVSLEEESQFFSIGNDRVIMLHQTSDKTIWVGTESGLFTFDSQLTVATEIELVNVKIDSQTKPVVWDMEESENGTLWLATMHHGVLLWDREERQLDKRTLVTSILPDTNNVSTVYSLEIDNFGHVWCSTDIGLIRIDPVTKRTRVFSQQHGLQLTEFDFGVAHKDSSGLIYFGGSEGYTRFDPNLIDDARRESEILITKITLPEKVVPSISYLKKIEKIQLTHKDYFVQFDFSVLDFLDPEKNEYRYILEGFDPEWIENGTRNSATYTSLPPGDYVLRIQGANSAGVWNREGISIEVEVLPPPWQTWWAFTSYALLAIFFGWLGKRAYDSYVIEQQAEKKAIVMFEEAERADDEMQEQLEIHDELVKSVYRHSVSTLKLVSEVIGIKGSWLSADDAREVTDGNIKRVESLALLEDCLYYQNELLLADLHKFTDIIISRLLKDSPTLEETVTTINEVSSRALPFEQASPLAIAIYELLENAIQHAFEGAGPHYIHIILAPEPSEQADSEYRLTVEDNGLGIPENIDPLSSQTPGLAIVAAMVKRLSGEISCTLDRGTLVTITFHCPQS